MPLLETLPPSRLCAADTAYDSNALRTFLIARGTVPVIPNNPTRKHIQPFDAQAYKRRNVIERTFCRLKDWRRLATRYDKLAANFAATCYIAAIVTCWISLSLNPSVRMALNKDCFAISINVPPESSELFCRAISKAFQ